MTVKEILGRNIRLLRNSRGWSQEELADRAGIDRGHISDMELAKHYARLDRIEMIARALGLPPHQLLDPATADSLGDRDA